MSKEDSAATGSRLDARVLTHRVGSAIVQRAVPGGRRTAGCPSGQRERSVKPSAQPTLVRTQHLPPPRNTAPDLLGGVAGVGFEPNTCHHLEIQPLTCSYAVGGCSCAVRLCAAESRRMR